MKINLAYEIESFTRAKKQLEDELEICEKKPIRQALCRYQLLIDKSERFDKLAEEIKIVAAKTDVALKKWSRMPHVRQLLAQVDAAKTGLDAQVVKSSKHKWQIKGLRVVFQASKTAFVVSLAVLVSGPALFGLSAFLLMNGSATFLFSFLTFLGAGAMMVVSSKDIYELRYDQSNCYRRVHYSPNFECFVKHGVKNHIERPSEAALMDPQLHRQYRAFKQQMLEFKVRREEIMQGLV